jgi:hypothetical protein
MSIVRELLGKVLRATNLTEPDGRPLCQYRIDERTHAELRHTLRTGLAVSGTPDRTTGAALCLFIAEQFCESYQGGPWAWRDALDTLDYRGHYTALYEPLMDALEGFWKRPLLRLAGQREFLVTLACEGGLPRWLLRDTRVVHFARYLRELMEASERYRRSAANFAASTQGLLPRSLRNETVFEISARLVDAIVALRVRGSALDATSIADLPLRIDGEVAGRLVRGLLAERLEILNEDAQPFWVETFLDAEDELRLHRRLSSMPSATAAALAGQLGIDDEVLPPRIYLHLRTSSGDRVLSAIATRIHGTGTGFSIELIDKRGIERTDDVVGDVLLSATAGGADLACVSLPGGHALDGVTPWVFEGGPRAPRHALLSVGTLRTRADSVVLAVVRASDVIPQADAKLEGWGDLVPTSRRVLWVSGSVGVTNDDEVTLVVTHQAAADSASIVLLGAMHPSAVFGSHAWRGVPQVRERIADGTVRRSRDVHVEWRLQQVGAPWIRLYANGDREHKGCRFGAGYLRVLRGGETLFRTGCVILPPELTITVHPRTAAGGIIAIKSKEVVDAGIASMPSVTYSSDRDGDLLRLTFETSMSPPPPFVTLFLRFAGDGESRVRMPFPARAVVFLGPGDTVLRPNARTALSMVSAVRARAITPLSREHFVLEMKTATTRWEAIAALSPIAEGTFELPLDAVRGLLSAELPGDRLDDVVRVRISIDRGVQAAQPPEIQIGWYDVGLTEEIVAGGAVLSLNDPTGSIRDRAALSVRVRPLTEHDAAEEELLGDGSMWLLDTSRREQGAWLVIGRLGDVVRLRPFLHIVRSGPPRSASGALEAAMELPRPRRMTELARAVRDIRANLGDPQWCIVRGFIHSLGSVPPPTFDLVRAIAQEPEAAILSLFFSTPDELDHIWDGLQHLGCVWWLLPVRAWISAARTFEEWLAAKAAALAGAGMSPAEIAVATLDAVTTRGVRRGPFLSAIFAFIHERLAMMPKPLGPSTLSQAGALRTLLETQERQALLRRRANDRWPDSWSPRSAVAALNIPRGALDNEWIGSDAPWRISVYDAPVVAAAITVFDAHVDDELSFRLRRIRAFDDAWFDLAHATTLTRLLASYEDNGQ